MDGFKKIDFTNVKKTPSVQKDSDSTTLKQEMRLSSSKKFKMPKNVVIGIVAAVVLLVLFVVLGIVVPGLGVAKDAKATYAELKIVIAAAKQQNVQVASDELNKTRDQLEKTQKDL